MERFRLRYRRCQAMIVSIHCVVCCVKSEELEKREMRGDDGDVES